MLPIRTVYDSGRIKSAQALAITPENYLSANERKTTGNLHTTWTSINWKPFSK